MSSTSEEENQQVQGESSDDVVSDEAAGSNDNTEHDGESVSGGSETEESGDESDLDYSSTETESDEDDEEYGNPHFTKANKANLSPKIEKITQQMTEKYEKRQGRQLYIRFPEKLPENMEDFQTKVKSLSELIVTGHKPRQKHVRFCLVDFASSEDRDKTLKELQKNMAKTKLVASIPRTDSTDFVKKLAEKKLNQIEKKKAKLLLKKERRKAESQKEFTSTIVVLNIPQSASAAQVKELFPDAVDMHMRGASKKYNGTSIATITLPSTADARKNFKRSLTLGSNKLIIRFNTTFTKKNKKHNKEVTKESVEGEDVPTKGPTAPNANLNKKEKNNKKRDKAPEEQEVPSKKPKSPLSQKKKTGDDGDSEVSHKKVKVMSVQAPQLEAQQAPKAKKGNQEGSNKPSPKKNDAEPKGVGQKQKQKKKGKKLEAE